MVGDRWELAECKHLRIYVLKGSEEHPVPELLAASGDNIGQLKTLVLSYVPNMPS